MATKVDIANKALTRIGVKTPDNAVDSFTINGVISSLEDWHALLFELGDIKWRLSSIPDSAVGPTVDELAWYIRDDFQISDQQKLSLQAAQQVARRNLHAINEVPDSQDQAEGMYY